MAYDAQTPVACDVFPIMGQSNAVGTQGTPAIDLNNECATQGTPDDANGRIFQMRQLANGSTIIVADEPLEHFSTVTSARDSSSSIGFSLAFARWYRSNILTTGRSILLVPCAVGGSGFSDGNWNPGDTYYESVITRVNLAVSKHAGNKLIAMLWHQGEEDAAAGWTQNQYQTAFSAMVTDFRSRVTGGNKCRVVVGGLTDANQIAHAAYGVINGALADMPNQVAGCVYASSTGLSGNGSNDLHFTASAARTLGGVYGTALQGIFPSLTANWTA